MRDFIVKICDNQSARQSAGAGFKENVDMDELISKKAVIEAIEKARANVGHNLERSIGKSIIEILDDVGRDVNRLPTAEPKRETTTLRIGRTRNSVTMWYECAECGEPVDQEDAFCRRCGRGIIHE